MRHYLVNFWVWWYRVKLEEYLRKTLGRLAFTLEYTNTLPMARNLTVPLFQDNTAIGRGLALIIRGLWVWFGGMLSLLMSLPFILMFSAFVLAPIVVVVGLLITLVTTLGI